MPVFSLRRIRWFNIVSAALLCAVALSDNLAAQDGADWLGGQFPFRVSNRRDNGQMMELVQPICKQVGESTVQILSASKPVSLGVIVHQDGLVLTKRSELSGDPIRVRLTDGRLVPARVAAVRRDADLALLQAEASQLQAAEFSLDEPAVGSFLVTVGRGGTPIRLGVVSVASRPIVATGRLGVQLGDDAAGRVEVENVVPSSGAYDAGIKAGDKILAVDGRPSGGRAEVMRTLQQMFPGESVRLTLARGEDKVELDAEIREFSLLLETENDARLNGPRNNRLSGFGAVIQHDTVLDPDQCGGPVLDSSGKLVGINIARAGRVVSYALPSSLVQPLLKGMIDEAIAAKPSN